MLNFANFPPEPSDVTLSFRARREIEEQISTSGFQRVNVIECGQHAAGFLLDIMKDPTQERVLAAISNAALDIVSPLSHYQFIHGAEWLFEDIERGQEHEAHMTARLNETGVTV